MTKYGTIQTETTSSHMHDDHANSQSNRKLKKIAKSITILWLRITINFLFPFLYICTFEIQINNFQKKFVVCRC